VNGKRNFVPRSWSSEVLSRRVQYRISASKKNIKGIRDSTGAIWMSVGMFTLVGYTKGRKLRMILMVSGRHSQGPPFPASVVIFIMLMLLQTKEVLINKKLD